MSQRLVRPALLRSNLRQPLPAFRTAFSMVSAAAAAASGSRQSLPTPPPLLLPVSANPVNGGGASSDETHEAKQCSFRGYVKKQWLGLSLPRFMQEIFSKEVWLGELLSITEHSCYARNTRIAIPNADRRGQHGAICLPVEGGIF